MAGSYRPVPVQTRKCTHCRTPYETRHARTLYCSDSCRQRAYQARSERLEGLQPTNAPAKGDLALSLSNVGVIAAGAAAGSAVAQLGTHLIHEKPAQRKLHEKLDRLEAKLDQVAREAQQQGTFLIGKLAEVHAQLPAKAKQLEGPAMKKGINHILA